ncbi:MAG: hypothetical protein IIY44_06680 [Erysipelotrichales bacterium]|nr:hypothetical protein [Erysipelotrichales bacterium]MBQ2478094.1 hypothetical protein [Erysipelotrichales bacterium]
MAKKPDLSAVHDLAEACAVLKKTEYLNSEISSLNKQILTNSSHKEEQQSIHATKMIVFTFIAVTLVLTGILIFLLNMPAFMNWFNLTFYGKTQMVFVIIIVAILAIAGLVARLVGNDVMNAPFNSEKSLKKLQDKKVSLQREYDRILEEKADVLAVLPEDFRTYEAANFAHNTMVRNPKLTLEDALKEYLTKRK